MFALFSILPFGLAPAIISINGVSDERWLLVMQAIKDAINDAGLTPKEAFLTMGLDAPRWSRICAGEEHLSIFRLASLPVKFQIAFVSRYMFSVVRAAASEIAEDFRRRA